ncbi:uncharacterized protein LOC143279498 isoform X2 [Babylonia areolata]|uniref:uncharacterized protein LOC143279498 isoform X2 n=1 Tax=Babylonia areolata TaxID=304850 RepID=UPI003FD103E4
MEGQRLRPYETRRHGGGSRHNSETDTRSKSESSTPARPSSVLSSRLTNSTPRPRLRPAAVRSLSVPLGRSMSMRVSKKEKRWSMRLEDPKSPVSTTYQDDFQSPEALSLQSLNLETTTEHGSNLDVNAPTTYRESFRWFANRSGGKHQTRSNPDERDTPRSRDTKTATVYDGNSSTVVRSRGPISPNGAASKNGHASEQSDNIREDPATSRSVIQSPTSARSLSYFRRNASSDVVQNKNSGQTTLTADIKPSKPTKPASEKNMSITKPANGGTPSKPANANTPLVNGLPSPATPQAQKLTNGVRGPSGSASDSEHRTPRRIRAYQLQSSNGGSPFVYGSDSGAWV